jgi:hypothetical protein
LVRKVVDPTATALWEKYGEVTINLFEDWIHLTIHQVKEWQSDINHQGGDENRRSSAWLLAFLRNSCTQELKDGIKDLEPFEKGGATYLYLIMAHLFQMTTGVVTALKSVITRFSRDGIAKIKGENVFLVAKQLTAVVKSLARVDALSDELLERLWMGCQKVLSLSSLRFSSWKVLWTVQSRLPLPTLEAAKQHLTKSFTLFQKLPTFTTHNWLIPSGHVSNCWNCNGDHGVNKCKLPKDQARIEANKKKWEEEKKKKSGSVSNSSGSGGRQY